jgi:hypothetical protein
MSVSAQTDLKQLYRRSLRAIRSFTKDKSGSRSLKALLRPHFREMYFGQPSADTLHLFTARSALVMQSCSKA